MKIFKALLIGLSALIALAAIAVAAVVFLIDPNNFKPIISDISKQHGVQLKIDGDLDWSVWPQLALEAEGISIAPATQSNEVLAKIPRAALVVALMPLLKGNVEIYRVELVEATLNLAMDKDGKGNWQAIIDANAKQASAAPKPDAPSTQDAGFNVAVEALQVSSLSFRFEDQAQGTLIRGRDTDISLRNFNSDGEFAALTSKTLLDFETNSAENQLAPGGGPQSFSAAIEINQKMLIAGDFSQIKISEGILDLNLIKDKQEAKAQAEFSIALNLSDETDLNYSAELALKAASLRKIIAQFTTLDTSDKDVLGPLRLSTKIEGKSSEVAFTSIDIKLDSTSIGGYLKLKQFDPLSVDSKINIGAINLDKYLPPEDPDSKPEQKTEAELAIPFELLQQFILDVTVGIEKLQVKKLALESVQADIDLDQGKLATILKAKAYTGDISLNAQVNQKASGAKTLGLVNIDADLKDISLQALLKDLEFSHDKFAAKGFMSIEAKGKTAGSLLSELIDAVDMTAQVSGKQLEISPYNLEENICKAIGTVSTSTQTQAWPNATEIEDFSGQLLWRNNAITLQTFNAGLGDFLLTSTGALNLETDQYQFRFPVRLKSASLDAALASESESESETAPRCKIPASEFWNNRSLSLVLCKGSLENLAPAEDCRLDKEKLRGLAKDYAEYKITKKHGKKIDAAEEKLKNKRQELKEESREKIDKKKDKVEEKLDQKKEELLERLKKPFGRN